MRIVLAAIFLTSLIFCILFGIDMVTIEGKADATVFQQLVARISFGICLIVLTLALGFGIVANEAQAHHAAQVTLMQQIASVAGETASATKAAQAVLEAPLLAARAAEASTAEQEKKARLAAYRAELQGKPLP